jgi:hypothetical protein
MGEQTVKLPIQNFTLGHEMSRHVVVEVEPAEAKELAAYYDLAKRAPETGEPVNPFIFIGLKNIGVLSVYPEDIEPRRGNVEDLSSGHSLRGTVLTQSGEAYRAEGAFLQRSLLAKALGKCVKGYFTFWKDTPESHS